MMPKKDGFTLAKEIKKVQEISNPIFEPAKNQKDDSLKGSKSVQKMILQRGY